MLLMITEILEEMTLRSENSHKNNYKASKW